jgi:hypothetical protein
MSTLARQRQNLENDVIASKGKIWEIRNSEFPDLKALNQLQDAIERNMQLINMIDQHIYSNQQSVARS